MQAALESDVSTSGLMQSNSCDCHGRCYSKQQGLPNSTAGQYGTTAVHSQPGYSQQPSPTMCQQPQLERLHAERRHPSAVNYTKGTAHLPTATNAYAIIASCSSILPMQRNPLL